MREIFFVLNKQIYKRVYIRFCYFITFSYYFDVLLTMFYSLRSDFLFNIRSITSYTVIENENKRRRLKLKRIFNNIIIDENINSFNSNSNLLHSFNSFNNNFNFFIQFIFTRERYLQNIIFVVNDRVLLKKDFKRRVFEI